MPKQATPGPAVTAEILPKLINIARFEPNHILCIKIPVSIIERAVTFVASFVVYLLVAKLCGSIVDAVVEIGSFGELAALGIALILWILANRRGVIIAMYLNRNEYRLSSPLAYAKFKQTPDVKVHTHELSDGWSCELFIAEYRVGTNVSSVDVAHAELPFTKFVNAFPQTTAPTAEEAFDLETHDASLPQAQNHGDVASPKQSPSRKSACPLIILVHGTFGRTSSWAIPDKSNVVEQLRERISTPIEFYRFPWTGANRTSARLEAADRLATKIDTELHEYDRQIFILAHSHGGNVVNRSLEALSERYRQNIRCVMMATPFLRTGFRFNVRDVYEALPSFLKENLSGFLMFGFWIGCLIAITVFQNHFVAEANRISVFGGSLTLWQLPILLILFFLPPLVFNALWSRGEKYFKALPEANTSTKPQEAPFEPEGILVVTSFQDEAFLALSILVNLLALVHQAFFVTILFLTKGMTRVKIFSYTWSLLWVVTFLPGLLFLLVWSMTSIVQTTAGVWPGAVPEAGFLAGSTVSQVGRTLFQISEIGGSLLLLFLIGTGFLACIIIFSMLFVGVLRVGVLSLIGVSDQIYNRDTFLNAVLGTVSISTIPEGRARTVNLPMANLFAHTKIYDDNRVIEQIGSFIEESLAHVTT